MKRNFQIETIGIVGAGAMGRGIAQIAAQAGIGVKLHDAKGAAADAARAHLIDIFGKLSDKGKLSAADAAAALARIGICGALDELADCDLIIEAVVEDLAIKQRLFQELETIARPDCILASNTSSLSITAIASACREPSRVAGYHFFNPVPLMKVVEVVDGLRGDPRAGDALSRLARRMGHMPVRAQDMPGFIVNHAGRAMNTEGLRVAAEGVADFAQIDRIMREQAGFRLGPFELLDLTGLDVSHPVMESIYRQFYEDPRFTPSPIAALRVAAGLVGRKAGAGFYDYANGRQHIPLEAPAPRTLPERVWISEKDAEAHAQISHLANCAGVPIDTGPLPASDALLIVAPLGTDATTAALAEGLDASRTVAVDTLFTLIGAKRRTLMATPATSGRAIESAQALFVADGVPVTVIRDSAGFVCQRIVAAIVNLGCDIAQRRIATPPDIDLAVRLGLSYPQGPLALGDTLGPGRILRILGNMLSLLHDPRYRPSPWLVRRARLGLSLLHTEEHRLE